MRQNGHIHSICIQMNCNSKPEKSLVGMFGRDVESTIHFQLVKTFLLIAKLSWGTIFQSDPFLIRKRITWKKTRKLKRGCKVSISS